MRRGLRTALRAAHIFAAATLLGGYIFDQCAATLQPWLPTTVITALLRASMAVLFEARGLAVLIKLGRLALLPVFWGARIALLLAALVIGALTSHMPGRYRHKLILFEDRIVPDQRRG